MFLGAWVPRIVEASSCTWTSARLFFNLIRSSQPSAHLLQTVFISKFFPGSALSSVERMHTPNSPESSSIFRSVTVILFSHNMQPSTVSLLRHVQTSDYALRNNSTLRNAYLPAVTVVEWEGAYPGLLNSTWDLNPAAFELGINDQKKIEVHPKPLS